MRVNYNKFSFNDSSYNFLNKHRNSFQRDFIHKLLNEPGISQRVLDIGCGHELNPALDKLRSKIKLMDGVDPFPNVKKHPMLNNYWCSSLEDADIPNNTYDLAYSYNVIEHVSDPIPFLASVSRVLKPGGIYYALGPNNDHPFARLSRVLEVSGFKPIFRRFMGDKINNYPAYYRMNSPKQILKSIDRELWSQIDFYWHPCVQWDTYFPKFLRFIPYLYDYVLGIKNEKRMAIFMVRLKKNDLSKK